MNNPGGQFRIDKMERELIKAHAGFSAPLSSLPFDSEPVVLSTGNWGCGAFGGDLMLKFLLQWISASLTPNRKMKYFSFSEPLLTDLDVFVKRVSEGPQPTAQWLWKQLMAYPEEGEPLLEHAFQYILKQLPAAPSGEE